MRSDGSREYTRKLLLDARREISASLGVPEATPEEMLANLCTFLLPNDPDATDERVLRLHDVLFDDYQIEVPAMNANGKLYVRASSQVYNDRSDFDALKAALVEPASAVWRML